MTAKHIYLYAVFSLLLACAAYGVLHQLHSPHQPVIGPNGSTETTDSEIVATSTFMSAFPRSTVRPRIDALMSQPHSYFDVSGWQQYADDYVSFKYPPDYRASTSTYINYANNLVFQISISVYDGTIGRPATIEGDGNPFADTFTVSYQDDIYGGSLDKFFDPELLRDFLNDNTIRIDGYTTYVIKGVAQTVYQNLRSTFVGRKLFLFTCLDSLQEDANGAFYQESGAQKRFDTMLTTVTFLKP